MKLQTAVSYNLDVLCFLNIMTEDELFVDRHEEVFNTWYPRLSEGVKSKIRDLITGRGDAILSPHIALFISA